MKRAVIQAFVVFDSLVTVAMAVLTVVYHNNGDTALAVIYLILTIYWMGLTAYTWRRL